MSRALLALALAVMLPMSAHAQDSTVVVVVRHAEKATDDPRDPSLSEAGLARAEALAAKLAAGSLDAAYSTQFNKEQLERLLVSSRIRYAFLGAELGGRPTGEELYDVEGHTVSVFVMPRNEYPAGVAPERHDFLGQHAEVWADGDQSFAIVGDVAPETLAALAAEFRAAE